MVQESTNNNVGAAAGAIAPLGLPLHTRLGEFEIIDVIGEGGFSIVYLARDHQLQRTVAIKEYLPEPLHIAMQMEWCSRGLRNTKVPLKPGCRAF
jgi:serine/threonine protein kinase